MKKIRKILAGFMAAATMLTCTSLNFISAETSSMAEETADVEVREMGTLYIRKGGYKVIPNSLDAFDMTIENEDVAVIEDHPLIGDYYQVRAVESGTTKLSFAPFGVSSYISVWNVVVDDYLEDFELSETEVELCINDNKKLNIIDPYCDSYHNYTGTSVYNDNATWSSDNEDVVRVELGKLYPQSVGTATVIAELDGVVYECNVTVTMPAYEVGDIDKNEKIDLYDVIFVAKYIMGMTELNEEQEALADYNTDGVVDLYDAIEIAKTLMP